MKYSYPHKSKITVTCGYGQMEWNTIEYNRIEQNRTEQKNTIEHNRTDYIWAGTMLTTAPRPYSISCATLCLCIQ